MRILSKLCVVAGGCLLSLAWTGAASAQGQGQAQANQQGQQGQQNQGARNQGAQGNQQGGQGNNAQSGFYGGISQSPWFSNPTIRQQLQLNDEQFNNLNNAYTQSYTRYNQGVTGLDRNLNEAQRMQRLQELNHGFNNDFSKSLSGVLSDEAARQRYNQLDWQYRGYAAFNDPNIRKQLNLSDEQLQRLKRYSDEWNNQMSTWRREYPSDREGTTKSFQEARREALNRISSTLNPEQKRMWGDMTGKPTNWPAEAYFSDSSGASTSETNSNPRR